MQYLDEAVVRPYLAEISSQYHGQGEKYLAECVSSLLELSSMMLDRLEMQKNERVDFSIQLTQDLEQKTTSLQTEVLVYQQMISQFQRIQAEMIDKENEMYDKIVNLEEELRQAQLQNSLFANELKRLSFHEESMESIEVLMRQVEQLRTENQFAVDQLKNQKELTNKFKSEKQDWCNNYQESVKNVNYLEEEITRLNQQVAHQKQTIKYLRESLLSECQENQENQQNSINRTALKELHNSTPPVQSFKKQRNSSKLKSSSEMVDYIEEESDMCQVNHFTLDQELPADFGKQNKLERANTAFRRLASLLPDSPVKKKPERNIYKDFFALLCQCAKLNLKNDRALEISTAHLYDEYIANLIPFHKWYEQVVEYLRRKLSEKYSQFNN